MTSSCGRRYACPLPSAAAAAVRVHHLVRQLLRRYCTTTATIHSCAPGPMVTSPMFAATLSPGCGAAGCFFLWLFFGRWSAGPGRIARGVKVAEADGVHTVAAVHCELVVKARLVPLLHLLRERPELGVQVADVVLNHLQRIRAQARLLQRELNDVRARVPLDLLLAAFVASTSSALACLELALGIARHCSARLRVSSRSALPLVDVFDRAPRAAAQPAGRWRLRRGGRAEGEGGGRKGQRRRSRGARLGARHPAETPGARDRERTINGEEARSERSALRVNPRFSRVCETRAKRF